jgi:serine/threonine protein kinase
MYLVFEHVDGPTVAALIREPLDTARTLRVGAGIVEGLAAIHDLGVVHRDLKPSNVLVAAGDRAMITDFGIAALAEHGDGGTGGRLGTTAESDTTRLTRTNQAVGTPAYMAPEALHGDEPTSAADLYALGVILLELLLGKRGSVTPGRAHLDFDAESLERLRARAGAALTETLRACLANDPAARPSVSRVAEALAAAASRARTVR